MRSNQNSLVKIRQEAEDIFGKFIVAPHKDSDCYRRRVNLAKFGVSSGVVARSLFSSGIIKLSEDDKVKFHIIITIGFLIYSVFVLTDDHQNNKASNFPLHNVLMDRVANPGAAVKLQLSKYKSFEDFISTLISNEDKNAIFTIGALVLAGDLPFNFKMCDDFVSINLRRDKDGSIVSLSGMAPTIDALLTELKVKSEIEQLFLPPAPGFFEQPLANNAREIELTTTTSRVIHNANLRR